MSETTEVQHTPEPWEVQPHGEHDRTTYMNLFTAYNIPTSQAYPKGMACIVAPHAPAAFGHDWEARNLANTHRVVAAVNACAGIPTEALDVGVVGGLLEALRADPKAPAPIASVPDLMEFAADYFDDIDGGKVVQHHLRVRAATLRAAIARAEGRATPAPQGATQEGADGD